MNEIMKKYFGPIVFPTATNESIQRLITDLEQSFKHPIKQVFPYPIDIIKYYSNKTNKIVGLTFKVALAGLSKDEIKVQLKKGKILSISVKQKEIEQNNNDEIEEIYISKSISYRDGEISFKLFQDLDLDDFKPIFKDGLLTIELRFKEANKEDDIIDVEIQ